MRERRYDDFPPPLEIAEALERLSGHTIDLPTNESLQHWYTRHHHIATNWLGASPYQPGDKVKALETIRMRNGCTIARRNDQGVVVKGKSPEKTVQVQFHGKSTVHTCPVPFLQLVEKHRKGVPI